MLRRIVVSIALVVAWAAPAVAQPRSITGTVVDDRTGQPLKGVLLYLENDPIFAESDADGRFTLTVQPGRYTVAASFIGYALQRIAVDARTGGAAVTIRLAEGAGTYTERVTVSGRAPSAAAEAPGGAALFGRELQNLRGVTLDDPLRAVQALPAATATDDLYSEFAVRGDSFRHVGLTVDGVPSRFLMHTVNDVSDGGSIAMVNSEALGAVALLPGSYPQKVGRRLGGDVDLLTREGSRDRFAARAGLSGTSANVLVEGPLAHGRGSWLGSIRRSYLDYLIKRIQPDASFAFGFTDAQAKVVYDVSPRHQLQATMLIGRAAFEEGEENLTVNDNADATSRAWLGIASWRYTPAAALVVTQKVYTTGLRFANVNEGGTPLDSARWVNSGWRADGSYAPRPTWLLEFGGDAETQAGRHTRQRITGGTSDLSVFGDYDETGVAGSGYAQVRWSAARLTVTPGARLDHWGLSHATTGSPWINAEYRLDDRTTLRGGSGIYRQFPEFDQVYGLNGGGEHLHPERAVHVDVSVDHRLGERTHLLVTGYTRSEAHVLWLRGNEPRRRSTGALQPGRGNVPWVNALDGAGRGVEFLLRRDAPLGLSGWVAYAFSRLRYTDVAAGESFWANADQRHTGSVYGQYRLSSKTSVSAKYRYGSNYPLQGYVAGAPVSLGTAPMVDGRPQFFALAEQRNTLRLPAYSRLDVRADRAFNWSGRRRLVLFVEVANVLNRENLRNTPPSIDRSGRVFGATEPTMPIVPSAGFVIEF